MLNGGWHFIMFNKKQQVIDYFCELVEIDSPSRNERAVADKLRKDLVSFGFTVIEDDTGVRVNGNTGNLLAYLRGNDESKPPILLVAHMDTVSDGSKPIKPKVCDGVIRSLKKTILSADDKAGVCAIIKGIENFLSKATSYGDIEVLFTVCEEAGLLGSKNIEVSRFKSKMAFVFDSSGSFGRVVIKAPSQNKMVFKIKGKAAHAGVNPEEGINAIKIAGVALSKMKLGRIDKETSANVGVIRGGKATNIVPDFVEMFAEARSHDDKKLEQQTQSMVDAVNEASSLYGGACEIEVKRSYSCFSLKEDDLIVRYIAKCMNDMGVKPQFVASGGGSDANTLNEKGIMAVNVACGYFKPHSFDEYLIIDDLINTTLLVEKLLEREFVF